MATDTNTGAPPAGLSVVILALDQYETIRKTLRHLQAQTIKDRLEILIVAPSAPPVRLDGPELREFRAVRVVEVGPTTGAAAARAAGVRSANAPVVVFAEDHAFPAQGWAEALLAAHRQPWAAVGPVMGNANPNTMLSWANLFANYGPWVEPHTGGVVNDLPGHNSSYKRALLIEYGDALEKMLEREIILHWDLQAKGRPLYLEPAAVTHHLNVSRLSSTIRDQFLGGRLFAGARAGSAGWSWPRRWLQGAAVPLTSLGRLRQILGDVRRSGRNRELLPRMLPALLVALAAAGIGELVGYLFGSGDAMERMAEFEFHRLNHVVASDREAQVNS